MTDQRLEASDPRWGEYPAEEWADAVMTSMKLGGIDHFYFVSGSELAFYQEAAARANARGWPTPKLYTVTHEGAALNAALGTAMVSGGPAATAAHVDVGTLNFGAGIHTAWRGSYPVLIMAGAGPRAYPGSMPGSREANVQWVQEPRDQGEIVRQYTKLDHRMEWQDNPGLMVSRLLQVAMSEPKGPVYLVVPQEMAKLPMGGRTRFPTRDELGLARPAWPDPKDARQVAEWLIKANNPLIVLGQSGRNPESVPELVRLAELLAVPVMDGGRVNRLNFPTTHSLFGTGPQPTDADVLVAVEAVVPYQPIDGKLSPDTKIVWVDVDPVQSRSKTMEFHADMWLSVPAVSFAQAVYDAATSLLSISDMGKIEDRRAKLYTRKKAMLAADEDAALAVSGRNPIHPRWIAHQVASVMEPDTIMVDDVVSYSAFVRAHHHRTEPGTYFKSGGSSGGFGSGAAFGAKIAAPDRDVVLTTGDGYFMFGSPLASLWAASHYKAAFLTVVFVNKSYSTGTAGLQRQYPEGHVVGTQDWEGGTFDPPPNFAKLAEAANCYGESVMEADQVGPALKRGLDQVHNGIPAVIAVDLPTIPQTMMGA
jgi:acetolactate synthase-1/2/3 large subunit